MTSTQEIVYVHDEGTSCWCQPDVVPIGIEHHCKVGEIHELTVTGDERGA